MSDRRPPRKTRKLEAQQAARFAKATRPEELIPEFVVTPNTIAEGSQPHAGSLRSRTTTLSDPMTMALLAEVARSSHAVEFDPTQLAEAAVAADKVADELPHPHVKRRG